MCDEKKFLAVLAKMRAVPVETKRSFLAKAIGYLQGAQTRSAIDPVDHALALWAASETWARDAFLAILQEQLADEDQGLKCASLTAQVHESPKKKEKKMSTDVVRFTFENFQITSIIYKGQRVFVAREVGRALGYEDDGRRFVRNLTGEWSDEMADVQGVLRIEGDEVPDILAQANAVAETATTPGGASGARVVTLLTRDGLFLAITLSRKPIGRKLRKWLSTEVLPEIEKTGSYLPPKVKGDNGLLEVRKSREQRLSFQAETARMRMAMDLKEQRAAAMRRAAEIAERNGKVSADIVCAIRINAEEIVIGEKLPALLPPAVEQWQTPEQIATRFGSTTAMVGHVITDLGIRGKNPLSEAMRNTTLGGRKDIISYRYTEKAAQMIHDELLRRGKIEN